MKYLGHTCIKFQYIPCSILDNEDMNQRNLKELNHPLHPEKTTSSNLKKKKVKLYLIQVRRDILFRILQERIFMCYKKHLFQIHSHPGSSISFISRD